MHDITGRNNSQPLLEKIEDINEKENGIYFSDLLKNRHVVGDAVHELVVVFSLCLERIGAQTLNVILKHVEVSSKNI